MISFFHRKKDRLPKHDPTQQLQTRVQDPQPVSIDPKLGINVQYGISIICKQKGEASLIINGLEPQLIEMIAAGLKSNPRFRKLIREGFRKANLPIK